jgi:hypothetical protein
LSRLWWLGALKLRDLFLQSGYAVVDVRRVEVRLDHMNDGGGSGWHYELPTAPRIDPVDEVGFGTDVDVGGFAPGHSIASSRNQDCSGI